MKKKTVLMNREAARKELEAAQQYAEMLDATKRAEDLRFRNTFRLSLNEPIPGIGGVGFTPARLVCTALWYVRLWRLVIFPIAYVLLGRVRL